MSGPLSLVAIGEAMIDVLASRAAGAAPVHGRVRLRAGGTPVNAALSARRAGGTAAVVARVGSDGAAAIIRAALETADVTALLVTDERAPTGVFVDVDGAIVADRGANDLLTPADVAGLPTHDALLLSGYTLRAATAAAASSALAASGARWRAVDVGGAAELPEPASANVVLGTAEELAIDLDALEAEALVLAGRYEIVVVKLGARGALVAANGSTHAERPPRTMPGGAVGAGDALDGAFLAGLARGDDPAGALALGVEAAAAWIALQTG